jgi:hypothetical protein
LAWVGWAPSLGSPERGSAPVLCILPTLMLTFGKAFWLEWIAVGLFITYVLSVGKASLSITKQPN